MALPQQYLFEKTVLRDAAKIEITVALEWVAAKTQFEVIFGAALRWAKAGAKRKRIPSRVNRPLA
jgi:hypothetical protein